MLISVLRRAGVFYNHKGEAESGALAGGGFDADVTGDAGEDNCVDAAALELLLKVCAGKGAPVALRDEDVVGLETRGGAERLQRVLAYHSCCAARRLETLANYSGRREHKRPVRRWRGRLRRVFLSFQRSDRRDGAQYSC